MSKSRLFSGKIKKLGSTKLTADRYEYLDTSQAEPDLGSPNLNGSVLTGSTTTNVRTWSDLLTIEGPTVRVRSTLSNVGFFTPNALVIDGGVGIGGDLNILGKALINNVEVLTTQSGLTSQFGQSVIDLVLRITTSTNSTGTSSGALVIYGGVGINKDVWIGGTTFAGNVYSNGSLVGSSTGTTSSFLINNFTQSTSTNSGALVVKGGVGIGGALFVNTTSYVAGSQIITTATINQYANQTAIFAGTDTAVNTSTGNITIWNTSTLQTITNRGNSTTNTILIANTTTATSSLTGALQVLGGAGIQGDLYVGGRIIVGGDSVDNSFVSLNITGGTSATSTTTGALTVVGGVGIGGSLFVKNISYIDGSQIITTATINQYANQTTITAGTDTAVNTSTGNITIWNTSTLQTITDRGSATSNAMSIFNATSADNSTTGALVVLGGVGIGQDLRVGGDIYTRDQQVLTTSTVNDYANQTSIIAGTDTAISTSTGNITIWNTSTLQSVTGRGATTTNAIVISNITSATSTATGALIVAGGVGIGGDLYVGVDIYSNNQKVVTTASINQYANQTSIIAGTDTAISTSTGSITIWNTSTLQSVTGRGATTTNAIVISNITSATSTATGALIVAGGVGIGGDLYIAGNIVANKLTIEYTTITTTLIQTDDIITTSNLTQSTSTDSGALLVAGGAGIGGNLWLGGNLNIATGSTLSVGNTQVFATTITAGTDTAVNTSTGNIVIWNTSTLQSITNRGNTTTNSISIINTASSTSTTTGALIVTGGVGIGGNLYVGSTIYSSGDVVLTTATVNQYANQTSITAGVGISVSTSSGNVIITNIGVTTATGSTYIGISTSSGNVIITNLGVTNLSSGTDITLSATTGSIIINNVSTLQSITDRGATTTNVVLFTNTTTSTSITTGAVVITGGLGVGGQINADSIIAGGVRSTSTSTAPVAATVGDIWYNTNNDRLYRYTTVNNSNKFWLDFTGQKVKYLKNL